MEFCLNVVTEGILEELIKNPEENVVMSPASMNVLLNMVASGSAGKTLEQFLRILGAKNITDLNSDSLSLMALLDQSTAKNAPLLSMVNAMFVEQRQSFRLKPSFQEMVRKIYKTEPKMVDFTQQKKLKKEVNSWAEKNTNGLIKEILPPNLNLQPPLILANALYFKATWKDPFKASSTKDRDFHLLNGTTIKVPFMAQTEQMRQSYGSFLDFKVLRLYYNSGDYDYNPGGDYSRYKQQRRICMDIILPERKDGLQDLLHKFNYDTKLLLEGGFELKTARLTKLWIPKWKFSHGFQTVKLMEKLGLTLPFKYPDADFTEMMDSPSGKELFIGEILQKSFVEVNEEGTKAAAVSLGSMVCGCSMYRPPPPPEVQFVADHPFMFVIREEVSGAVIFTGAVLNPLLNN